MKSHHTAREQDSALVRAVVALVFVCFVIACTAALPARASDKKEKEKAAAVPAAFLHRHLSAEDAYCTLRT